MKNIKTTLLSALLSLSIYAGSPPSQVTESFDFNNWDFGSDVESIEEGNVENFIQGDKTAVALWNVMGRYFHRETSRILGGSEYGIYSESNSVNVLSLLSIENYGIINSNMTAINMVGINGILNNYDTGTIFGSSVSILIDPEDGNSIYNDFTINNYGRITGGGLGIYKSNDKKKLSIYNTGTIDTYNYAVLQFGYADIINEGSINSDHAALYLLDGGEVNNTGSIYGRNGVAIKSGGRLTLKGNGSYQGDITYNGTAENSMAYSFLIMDNISNDFKNGRLTDWNNIYVVGGENYFNVEYANFQNYDSDYRSNVYIANGSILHTGSGDNGMMNLIIQDGLVNPYENSYDTNGNYFWNRFGQQYEGGHEYYDKREYEKLTVNNLTILDNGGLIIDMKDSKPYYSYDYYVEDGETWGSKHTNLDGTYGGYGYAAFKGTPFPEYHRINHDTIDVRGTATIADGATLYLVDHTLESLDNEEWVADGEAYFVVYSHLEIDALDGNIKFKDFSNIKFYSDIYGIDHLDNATGIAYLTLAAFDTDEYHYGIIDWWIQQAAFGFAEPPVRSQETIMSSMSIEPYQVAKAYSVKITDLNKSEELKQIIHSFTEYADIDIFMDSLNKLEYASLAASNLNSINTRVNSMYNRLGNYNTLVDNTGLDIWVDYYMTNGKLQGKGNHDISGHGFEVSAGFNKSITDNIVFGLSVNHTDYTSTVNDSGVHTNIDSEGYGVNVFGLWQSTASLTHKFTAGMTSYNNTDEIADFNSTEMFGSYRAEYLIKINQLSITPLAGFRMASVKYDDAMIDAENGLQGFTHNSLESELGVRLARQFKKLNVNVSGSWMHEMLDRSNTSTAYTSHGEFEQTSIERDADSFELGLGVQYQFNDKVMLDIDYTREFSANSDNSGLEAKLTFRF